MPEELLYFLLGLVVGGVVGVLVCWRRMQQLEKKAEVYQVLKNSWRERATTIEAVLHGPLKKDKGDGK